jgi:hypothetical protein
MLPRNCNCSTLNRLLLKHLITHRALQASKDCVQKTLKRLEEKISGRVLRHLLYLLRSVDKETQRRVAIALAHLSGEDDQRLIFVDGGGLEVLLDMMGSTMTPKLQKEGALAVYTLAKKAAALSPVENAPPPPTPQVGGPSVCFFRTFA